MSEHNLEVVLAKPPIFARFVNRWLLAPPLVVLAGLALPLVFAAGGLAAGITLATGGGGGGGASPRPRPGS